jgi:hypothetical protein
MKKGLLYLTMLFFTTLLNAQTVVFQENFDPPSNADQVTASGALNNFAINTRLFHSGTQCDSSLVSANDTAYLTTNSFSTMGYSYVFLNFAHICKIELLDGGEVQVSIDNGATWTYLAGAQYINPGNSQFVANGNKFNSNTYPLDWAPASGPTKPTNLWWKNESFNISALVGNQPNVKIRFALRDGNGNGAFFNHGWYIDDIAVTASFSELTPPHVTLKPPVIQDTVFNTGPFNIYAWISDASGIDTAYLAYKVNNGSNIYIPMVYVSDSTYLATIPGYTYNNQIDYYVHAVDNSTAHNAADSPNQWLYTKRPPSIVIVGTGTSTTSLLPTYGLYGYGWGSMVYKSNELNFNGVIDSISFYVNNTISGYTMLKQKVFIGHTTLTGFGTAQPDTSTMTVVYNGDMTFNGPGWYRIKLANTFTYNGVNNLAIYWVNKDGAYVTGYPVFRYTTTTPNYYCAYRANDTYSNVFPTSVGTQTYNRPNIRITYIAPLLNNDAGITQITEPSGTVLSSSPLPIKVKIKNFGVNNLNTVTVKWSLDGTYQSSIPWSGSLPEAVITLPYQIASSSFVTGPHTLKAWTENPNGFADPNHANDTATVNIYACSSFLNGTYTIGSGGNYPSFGAALVSMQNCGISGPVIFNVLSGTYNEQLNMPVINGISSVNTVTFQSASGNYADVIVQYAATAAANNFVVKLNGSSYLNFKNMTLQATGTAYATVINYSGNSTFDTFMGNKLKGITTTSTSVDFAIVYSPSGTAPDSVMTFDGNIIENGSFGFYLYGQGSAANQLENKTVIRNNQLINQYYKGVYLYYHNAPLIVSNNVTTNTTTTLFYGIQLYYCDNKIQILKNTISIPNSGNGIYLYYCDGISGAEGLTANNAINVGGVNNSYGIYDYYSTYQNIYYNSINVFANSATARAMGLLGSTSYLNHRFRNNVFAYTGPNSAGMAFYVGTTAMVSSSDFNDLYSTGTNIGYWGANQANLAAWQTASSQDANSTSINPNFISNTNLHTFNSGLNNLATPIVGITDDIDGDIRNVSTPDIGADEFTPLPLDLGILSIVSPSVTACGLGASENVTIQLKNFGLNTITTADIYYKLNNGTPVHEVFIGSIAPNTTYNFTFTQHANLSAIGNYTFKFYVAMTGDGNSLNDTISNYSVSNGWDFISSAYTMGFEPTENYSNWTTINSDAGTYKWVMPYASATYAHTGNNSAQFYNGTTNTGEDWLFSRCFYLQAGNTYSISFWYRVYSASYPQTITLKYGTSASSAGMTTTLATLASITNTTYQQSATPFVAPVSGTYYFGWSGLVGLTDYAYIDDINIKMVPQQEASLVSMTTPISGCGLTTAEPVTIKIKNTGGGLINGNLNAKYKIIGGSTTITESVAHQIAVDSIYSFTFATPANLSVTNLDSTFNIRSWVELAGDPIHANDTILKSILSRHVPANPSVIGATVAYGGTGILQAFSGDSLYWYTVASGGTPIGIGSSFTTPNLFVTTTYFVEAKKGGCASSRIMVTATVIIPANEIAVKQIITPVDGCTFGTEEVKAKFVNNGMNSISTPFTAGYYISGNPIPFTQIVSIPIPAGDSIVYSFSTLATTTVPSGNLPFTFKVFANVTGDPYHINDTLSKTVTLGFSPPDPICIGASILYGTSAGLTANSTYTVNWFSSPTSSTIMGTGLTFNTPVLYGNTTFYAEATTTFPGCPSHRVPVTVTVTGQPNIDAGLIAFSEPVSPTSLGNHEIKVILRNFGLNTLNTVQINLTVNGIPQFPVNWIGTLITGATDTVTLVNYNFTLVPYPGYNYLVAWTQNPNSVNDPTTLNDTISTTIEAHDPLSGVYYIRTSTPDFTNFTDAVTALNSWGVSGPVTMIVDTGTYNEHVSLSQITGASATNTVSFQSVNGINSSVKLQYAATGSADNYVFQLNGADYIRVNDITIKSTSTANYGRVVELKGSANYNVFEGNRLIGLQIASNNSTVVHCTDVSSANNSFIGNDMLYGYQSVYIYGTSANRIKSFKFLNNNISNFYYYGLYLYYNDSVQAIGNHISTNSVSATNYSIYSYYCDKNTRYEKNNIAYSGAGTFYGMYIYYNNSTATAPNWIVNNFISNTGSSGTAYGIYLYYSNYVNVYYNSVNIAAGSGTSTRALYQTGGTGNVNIKNNNFANTVGGYAYYVGTIAVINVSDYNNLYSTGGVLAYWGADRNTLALLQTASGKDVHSKSLSPNYFSPNDLHTQQYGIYYAGSPISGITTDIDGDMRDATTPSIGADEPTLSSLDVGVSMINAPVNPAFVGVQPVKVTIANYGLDTVNNVSIYYEIDGVVYGPFIWTGSLASNDTIMNVTVGNITLNAGNSIICAWTSMPNGIMDTMNFNDTVCSSVVVCTGPLSGTYTIGGTNPDYFTFNDAIYALGSCGIGGPVVFNVANGIYTERINLGFITGMSAVNTVTFQSGSGNNIDVVLQAAGTGTTNNYVVQLNGAKYTRFRNMTIKAATTSTYGRVVTVLNNSDYNIFEGNKIQSITGTSSNAAGIYTTGGNMDYNQFINNEISGGYYGIYWYAVSTSLNKATVFLNNSITDWYYYGIYGYYNDSLVVQGNTFRNGSNSTTAYNVYSYYGDNGCRYEKNNIFGNNTGTFYGLGILYNDGTSAEPTIVSNNMISEINGTGTAYGIYLSGSTYANLYYNSINIVGGSATAGRALYVTGGSNISLLNNNLVNSGLGYAYYNGTTTAIVQSEYNNIYSVSGSTYAYWGSGAANLASLQVISGKDLNSISTDPVFISNSDLHVNGVGLDGKATPVAEITDDIDGDIRNLVAPDIGADEFTPLPLDISVIGFNQPAMNFASAGTTNVVEVMVRNMGSDTIYSFPVSYKYGSGNVVTETWTGTMLPNQIINYVFNTLFTAVAGARNLCAFSNLAGDLDATNDTSCINFMGVSTFFVPYSDDFEGTVFFFTTGNLWEYGTPSATTINAAYSPTHAWATNLDGNYTNNADEYLYSPLFNFSTVDSAYLDFYHWYDTQSGSDGGNIQYTVNGGSTWLTLGLQNDLNGLSWYNSTANGTPCWSGNSLGYVHSRFKLHSLPGNTIINSPVPVQFRFHFFSNATTNTGDGWAVDNFQIVESAAPIDAGVIAIVQPATTTQTGAPVTMEVTIKNFGTTTLTSIPVRYNINGGAVTTETWTGSLPPNATDNYLFTTHPNSPGTTYKLCAFTHLTGDTYYWNDSTCRYVGTTPGTLDVGVTKIHVPGDTTISGNLYSVTVTITNFGLNTVTSIPLVYIRNGIQAGAGSWTGAMNTGDTVVYTFPTQYTSPLGSYNLCAKTQLAGDVNPDNDQTCKSVFGKLNDGIESIDYSSFQLLQNIPNPSNDRTAIVFVVPSGDKIRFDMIDLLGNSVMTKEIDATNGKNQLDIDVTEIPAGIYFYSVQYKDQKRTKRMVITK